MGRIFYKQPNGLMTIFSTNSDRPIYWNVNKEDYIKIKLEEYKEQLEQDAKEIFDDEDPYYVKDFEDMKDNTIYNIKNKEEFEKYLKDIGYKGSADEFRLYDINYKPWEEEEEIEDEDDEDDDFKNDPYDISYAR